MLPLVGLLAIGATLALHVEEVGEVPPELSASIVGELASAIEARAQLTVVVDEDRGGCLAGQPCAAAIQSRTSATELALVKLIGGPLRVRVVLESPGDLERSPPSRGGRCGATRGGLQQPRAREPVAPEFPPGVAFVGLLGIDASGEVMSSTGLAPIEDARVVLATDLGEPASYELVGFEAGAVEVSVTEPVLRQGKLRLADPRGAYIPRLVWSEGYALDGTATGAVAPRTLTADWVPDCPRIIAEASPASMSCTIRSDCVVTAAQRDCTITVGDGSCEGPDVVLDVGPTGALTMRPNAQLDECHAVSPLPGVDLALECTGNRTWLHRCSVEVRSQIPPLSLVVESQRLIPEDQSYHDENTDRPPRGFLAGLVVLGDQVLVARDNAAYLHHECGPGRSSVIDVLSTDSMDVLARVPTENCLTRLAPGVNSSTYGYALFSSGDGALAKVDAAGHVGPLSSLSGPHGPRGEERPGTLARWGDDLAVVFSVPEYIYADDVRHATVALVSSRSLAPTLSTTLDDNMVIYGLGIGGQRTVIGDGEDAFYTVTDAFTLSSPRFTWVECDSRRIKPAQILFHAPSAQVILPAADNMIGAVVLIDKNWRCRKQAFPWAAVQAYGAVVWPPDPNLVLIALRFRTAGNELGEAAVALFDPVSARFVSGAVKVGFGPIDALTVDAQNRIWGTLPWVGTVFRITPSAR